MTVEELQELGMNQMDEEAIENFLVVQHVGILGLSTDNEPYLLPMSYGYDRGSQLYFTFLVDGSSRKARLADQVGEATFLVFNAETMFHWRSVLLTGSIQRVPEEQRSEITADETPAWRPELIETASETAETILYKFLIEESTGISHAIQPPAFFERSSRQSTE